MHVTVATTNQKLFSLGAIVPRRSRGLWKWSIGHFSHHSDDGNTRIGSKRFLSNVINMSSVLLACTQGLVEATILCYSQEKRGARAIRYQFSSYQCKTSGTSFLYFIAIVLVIHVVRAS